jgi:phosphatidylinositol alpha-1,6-mannosyltransferase
MAKARLLLSEVFPPKTGGSGRWFWEIYRRMAREEVVVVAGEGPGAEEFDRTHDLRVARIPLTWDDWGLFSLRGVWNYGRSFAAVRKLTRRHAVDQIHCGRLLPEGWIARMLKKYTGLPYLCYVHGEEMCCGRASRQLGWMMRRVLDDAQLIIANSRNTADILRHGWHVRPDRVEVMHPGVDVDRFTPALRDAQTRAGLGWNDRPVVLTVGRLQRRKGHDQMIGALAAVRQAIPDVLYAIVGEGEERSYLETLVRENELARHVQFLGELDDNQLAACYQQCDLFVLPNRNIGGDIEGFGMVLLEAQACGRPVLAGDSGGTAETMRIRETGRTVDCSGPTKLAEAVIELLANPALCDEMGRVGRRWVVERFAWDALVRQATRLFAERMPK